MGSGRRLRLSKPPPADRVAEMPPGKKLRCHSVGISMVNGHLNGESVTQWSD